MLEKPFFTTELATKQSRPMLSEELGLAFNGVNSEWGPSAASRRAPQSRWSVLKLLRGAGVISCPANSRARDSFNPTATIESFSTSTSPPHLDEMADNDTPPRWAVYLGPLERLGAYILRGFKAAAYPLRGIVYFLRRPAFYPLFASRLLPLSIISLLVYFILFTFAFLPQLAFLFIFHGPAAWLNAIVLVLGEGLVIIQGLFEGFFVDECRVDVFDVSIPSQPSATSLYHKNSRCQHIR